MNGQWVICRHKSTTLSGLYNNSTMDDNTVTTSSSRKRSRSTTPIPSRQTGARRVESPEDVLRAQQLRDPDTRTAALNALLKLSFSHDTNYSVTGDSVLSALIDIVLECVQWKEPGENDDDDKEDDLEKDDPVFSSAEAWNKSPTKRNDLWAKHWTQQLGPMRSNLKPNVYKTLEVIVMIFRNMSFVGANHRMMAYSPAVLEILIGCLYDGYENPGSRLMTEESGATSSSGLAVSAMQTLLHLVPILDLSGQKLLSDKLFYSPHSTKDGPMLPNANSFGQTVSGGWGFGGMWLAKRLDTKEDVMSDVSKGFLLSFTADYLTAVWSMFPALCNILVNSLTPRPVLIMAVDLLQELINQARVGVVGSVQLEDNPDEIPTLRAVLVKMPDCMVRRLVDFLYVPRLGPDALEYVSPIHNIVTRVTAYKLLMGYDGTVDTDVRDRTLDLLVPLLELDSPRFAARLGSQSDNQQNNTKVMVRTRLWDALVPILTTTAGRSEAPHLATQVLKELAKAPENRLGLLYIQERMLKLACKNERVAHTVCHFLQLLPKEETDQEEEGEEEEDDDGGGNESADDNNEDD